METDESVWSSRASADFIPDGNLDKQIWTSAQQIRFERDAFQDLACPEIETSVATVWTPRFLYLAYWCKFVNLRTFEGENPAEERWGLWHCDVAEAFVAPSADAASHYFEFEVAPNNQWLDLEIVLNESNLSIKNWNSGFLHATQVDKALRMWTAEMRIPVQIMGVNEIDPGFHWRINFCRCDGPVDQRRFLSWCSLDADHHSFHQPTRFGRLRFADF